MSGLFLKGRSLVSVIYGLMYNWYAATDARNITNTGWHVPTFNELITLLTNWGNESDRGSALTKNDTNVWIDVLNDPTNSSGFSGVGAGWRYQGSFSLLKQCNHIHCSNSNPIYALTINPNGYTNMLAALTSGFDILAINGASIRLIKDDSTDPGMYVGNDWKIYPTCKIGNQVWTSVNLAETKYRNGDTIPEVTDASTWAGLSTGALCAYGNDWNNVGVLNYTGGGLFLRGRGTPKLFFKVHEPELANAKYGLLYNAFCIRDSRNVAPVGWHVPTSSEITTLINYLIDNGYGYGGGGNDIAFSIATTGSGEWGAGTPYGSPGKNIPTNNSSGFTAKAGGVRFVSDGSFTLIRMNFECWNQDINNYDNTYHNATLLFSSNNTIIESSRSAKQGSSIRLIKDDSTLAEMIGTDGLRYQTVKIGNQVWMKENYKSTKYRNGDIIPEVTNNVTWIGLTTGALCAYNNDWNNV